MAKTSSPSKLLTPTATALGVTPDRLIALAHGDTPAGPAEAGIATAVAAGYETASRSNGAK